MRLSWEFARILGGAVLVTWLLAGTFSWGQSAVSPSSTSPAGATQPTWKGLTVGKDTTLLTEPLRKDGTVDYVAALNARYGKDVTPQNNAFVGLLPAMGVASRFDNDTAFVAAAGGDPQEKGCYVEFLDSRTLQDKYDKLQHTPWKPEDEPELDAWIFKNRQCLQIIREATRRPHFWIPLVSSNGALSGASRANMTLLYRKAGELLFLDAMRNVGTGKYVDAWDDLWTVHRLSNLLIQDYDMIGFGCACLNERRATASEKALLAAVADPKLLSRIISDFGSFPSWPDAAEVARRKEIFDFPDNLQLLAASFQKEMDANIGAKDRNAAARALNAAGLWQPDWDRMARFGNAYLAEQFEAPDLKSKEGLLANLVSARDAYNAITDASRKDSQADNEFYDDPMGPAFLVPRQGETRADYSDRLVRRLLAVSTPNIRDLEVNGLCVPNERDLIRVAFVVRLYRIETGAFPDSVEAAAGKYLKRVPNDFWGKPINYVRTDRGFKIEGLGPLASTRDEAENRGRLIEIDFKQP